MNENSLNTRTLIVSFVVAIMALIPLRFVEVGQMMEQSQSQVLGAQSFQQSPEPTEVVVSAPELEAPYSEIENSSCVPKVDVTAAVKQKEEMLRTGQLSGTQIDDVIKEIELINQSACK